MTTGNQQHPLYGLMAEFQSPTDLVNAARKAREAGYRKMDAYSPFPIEEISEVLHQDQLPLVLIGGVAGGLVDSCFSIGRRSDRLPR